MSNVKEEKFSCKKCGLEIGGHNQYCHDGMCDNCFFDAYFPEEAQIVEADPNELAKLCKINEKENMKFWNFLKSDKLDNEIFKKIAKEITEKINCAECANCCKKLKIILNYMDIEKISKHLNVSEKEFISKFLTKNEENEFELKDAPCIFLENNKCRIYDIRPYACKEYPNLDKDVSDRCHQFFNNATLCPIVFNVLENAKEEFLEDIFSFENQDL